MEDSQNEAGPNLPSEPPLSESQTSSLQPKRRSSNPYIEWEIHRISKIEVSVHKPIMREDMFTKFFVYKIQGSDIKGNFEISRRYSDFEKIRQVLVLRWPGCFIPSLPPKKLNNTEKSVLEDRTKNFDDFCKRIAAAPHIHYSDAYQVFLRTRVADLDAIFQAFQKVRYEDIIDRYAIVFSHLAEKEADRDAMYQITTFGTFLQKAQGQFEKFKKIGKNFVEARKTYANEIVNMHSVMSDEYEKYVFSEYHGNKREKNVFYDSESKLKEDIKTISHLEKQETVEKLYEWIKVEGRDITAFLEAFAQREKYESLKAKAESKQKSETKNFENLARGKVSLKTLFTPKTKKDQTLSQIEDKMSNINRDIDNLNTIQELITAVLAYEEIDKFKNSRIQRYCNVVGETARQEAKMFTAINDYFNWILENPNVKGVASEK